LFLALIIFHIRLNNALPLYSSVQLKSAPNQPPLPSRSERISDSGLSLGCTLLLVLMTSDRIPDCYPIGRNGHFELSNSADHARGDSLPPLFPILLLVIRGRGEDCRRPSVCFQYGRSIQHTGHRHRHLKAGAPTRTTGGGLCQTDSLRL